MLQQLKNATAMKPYKDAGYNFRYIYYSTKDKGRKLFEAYLGKRLPLEALSF